MQMVTRRYVTIGRIIKSVGVKGEVLAQLRVKASFDELVDIEAWVTPPDLGWRSGRITSIQPHQDRFRLSFEGLDSKEAAKPLSGKTLVVAAHDIDEAILESATDEQSVIGYQVSDDAYGDLGTISDIIITGANDVWDVSGRYGQVLIPVIDEVVCDIDEDAGRIKVHLLPGLIEEKPR
jgi:16S rRNA processing protein RimM